MLDPWTTEDEDEADEERERHYDEGAGCLFDDPEDCKEDE